jgi:hypothetical protein
VGHWGVSQCSTYNVLSDGFADSSLLDYYDPASGQLVAIVTFGEFGPACLAGPADFSPPLCPSSFTPLCKLNDAGADAF